MVVGCIVVRVADSVASDVIFFTSFNVLIFCCSPPCIIVLQVASSCFFRVLWLEEMVDVIFTSFPWSSYSSVFFCFNAETWIPFLVLFLSIPSSRREAILISSLHFIFL